MKNRNARTGNIMQLRGWVRPRPPAGLLESKGVAFAPSRALSEWVRSVFVEEGGPLANDDHAHLRQATIGYLWTNVGNSRQGRRVIGQAESGKPGGSMGKWSKARAEFQIEGWFGGIPDFIMTLDGRFAAECGDAMFCALVEHELYHMGQARDLFGSPKFSRSGRPVFALRGHDVEEFVGVVRRYGADATSTRALVEAAQCAPLIAPGHIARSCGTCMSRIAA